MASKSVTVDQMLGIIDDSIKARNAKHGKDAAPPSGPLLTFLVGAGFSATAGLSSVNHLVVSLETFRKNKTLTWFEIFDQTLDISLNERGLSGPELTDYYFNLMGEVLPLPQSRHDFITAAIQWASERRVQMNIEGILLANLMIAGTGGNTHFHPRRAKRHWMAKSLTRHVFTTNFDEVMPNTFYFGNQPVEIIDSVGRDIHSAAEYPTVVYLHGRHLHFDLRNTRTELHAKKESKKEHEADLFDSFRKLLNHTGLVVIGYAGAKDKVTQTIIDALEDGNSLPYGLWWSAYRDKKAIFPEVRNVIEKSERAYILDPGKDAEQVMRSISKGAGLDEVRAIERWTNRLVTVNNAVTKFLARASHDFRKFNLSVVEALLMGDDDSIQEVVSEWEEIKDHVFDHSDKLFVIDVLENVTKVLIQAGKKDLALEVFEELDDLIGKMGNDDLLAKTAFNYGHLRVLLGDIKKAGKNFNTALKAYQNVGSRLGEAQSLIALANLDIFQDKLNDAKRKAVKAEEIFNSYHFAKGIGDSKAIRGTAESINGNYSKAQELLTSALDSHLEDGNPNEIIGDLRSIGHLLISLDKTQEAHEKFEEAYAKSKASNLNREIAHSQKALAEYFIAANQLNKAKEVLDLSKARFIDQFDFRGLVAVEFLLAVIHFRLEEINREECLGELNSLYNKVHSHGFVRFAKEIEQKINEI
jgi:tetratricopeptide (TPR) repeat protein